MMQLRFRNAFYVVIGLALTRAAAQDHIVISASKTAIATNTPAVSQAASELEPGHRLFTSHCASCHGPNGEGGKGPTLAQPNLPRASDDESLKRIIADGIQGTEMPFSQMDWADIERVAKYVRSLGALPQEPVPGNPERGAKLFVKNGCEQCHMIHGKGHVFGPDLSDVGRRRSATYVRHVLVDPSAGVPQSYSAWRADVSLPENFLYVRLVTHDGQELAGVRVNEDTFSIQIRDATGAIHSFFKSELAELHKDFGKSPMPTFAKVFTKEELDDLVAYLVSLRQK